MVFVVRASPHFAKTWFPCKSSMFRVNVHSARKWFPRNCVIAFVSPHFAESWLPGNCSVFGVSTRSARKWFPESGSPYCLSTHFAKQQFPYFFVSFVPASTLPESGSHNMVFCCVPAHTLPKERPPGNCLFSGVSTHSAKQWFLESGCIFVSAHTSPNHGAQKMSGLLVPARIVQENGVHGSI